MFDLSLLQPGFVGLKVVGIIGPCEWQSCFTITPSKVIDALSCQSPIAVDEWVYLNKPAMRVRGGFQDFLVEARLVNTASDVIDLPNEATDSVA